MGEIICSVGINEICDLMEHKVFGHKAFNNMAHDAMMEIFMDGVVI